MAIDDRRRRERAVQHELIVDTARRLAEREGWAAVTTRRLSTEIEYSQPVIYKHFASMDELAEAVALQGFDELADALGAARRRARGNPIAAVARAYLRFAADNPAVYDAMFVRTTPLRFGGGPDTPAPLTAAYGEVKQAVLAVSDGRDPDTTTEVFWATLHGLASLGRGGRLRPRRETDRIALLVAQFDRSAPANTTSTR